MADSVVSLLLETLNQLLDQDADLLLEVEDEIRSFHVELGLASGFIRNSEGQGNAQAVRDLAKKISDVAYEAEGDIDMLAFNIAKQRMRGKFGKLIHGFRYRSMLNDVSKKINGITKRVRDIYGNKVSNSKLNGTDCSQSFFTGDRKFKEVDLPCFPKVLEETLLDQLKKEDGAREIISIVGEVGIGKTVLAKKIYNNISVQGHFDCLVWVHVSRDCKAGELLNKILERFQRPVAAEDMKEEDLRKKISEYLQNKRYLIVMDDLRKIEGWDNVEQAFPDDGKGSRILLTCRPEYEDPQGRPTISHPLRLLNDKESWNSLCHGIFTAGICAPKFEAPGEQMAQKCKGSPLSLAFLGHLLVMQRQNVEAWYKLANYLNTSSIEGSNEHSINLLLSFVYENLPNHLSLCFLYFGMFPEGAEIPVRQLIQFWIAEGFIRQKGSTKMEDVGEQYLEELIRLNLIQVTARRTDDGVKTCSIHDLFRKFCISKGRETKYLAILLENLSGAAHEKTFRRLAIHVTSSEGVFSELRRWSDIRSFHYSVLGTDHHAPLPTARWSTLYKVFKLLRVCNLGMIEVSRVPEEVGRLIHLRYFRIRAPDMKHVPSSICNLVNLQTLDMRESSLSNLPNGIWKLQQLRHLHLYRLRNFCDQGNDEKSLGKLQTLSCIRPHKDMKRLMVKAKFPNVRKLKLHSQDPNETAEFLESLDHLYHLQSLKIVSASKLPDSNAFPLTLTKLTLQDTYLVEECVKTLEKLPNLHVLKLLKNSVNGEEINFGAGGFAQLQILQMVELKIITWVLGRKAMVNLRHLVISKCGSLEKIPDNLKSLANLQIVEAVWLSTNLRETLENILGKDGPKIMVVPDMSVAST